MAMLNQYRSVIIVLGGFPVEIRRRCSKLAAAYFNPGRWIGDLSTRIDFERYWHIWCIFSLLAHHDQRDPQFIN